MQTEDAAFSTSLQHARTNSALMPSASASVALASSACSCALSGRLPSTINSDRASDQDVYSAGASVTDARERSRTLICDSTCVLTRGRMLSYKLCEILKMAGVQR